MLNGTRVRRTAAFAPLAKAVRRPDGGNSARAAGLAERGASRRATGAWPGASRRRRFAACGAACSLLLFVGLACERKSDRDAGPAGARVAVPAEKPGYTFAAGLEEREAEIVGFLRHFLETCLAGDYEGYRSLVARGVEPDSRARFEKTLAALKSVAVESIEPVKSERLPSPSYRVLARAQFRGGAQSRRARGRGERPFAILVVREDGRWRAALAPPEMQPEEPDDLAVDGQTPTSGPTYPWDQQDPP
jgi:hypothetical protein